jgi:hypothetical protein
MRVCCFPGPGELLDDNANLVIELARPFAANQTIDNLIALRPGQPVGCAGGLAPPRTGFRSCVNHLVNVVRCADWLHSTQGVTLRCNHLSRSNWRDSNTGLGNGRIPFDVNTALVPAALRAVEVGQPGRSSAYPWCIGSALVPFLAATLCSGAAAKAP